MEEDFVAYLLDYPAVAAAAAREVTWVRRRQNAEGTAIALSRISRLYDQQMGAVGGLTMTRVQADCWGKTFTAARDASDAVVGAAHAIRGVHGATDFRAAFVESPTDTIEGAAPDQFFRTSLDLLVWHRPA